MSLIIDGILSQKLPWGLVLLGVAISIVLELCGIAALPFAVGVYLPLSSSMPIFIGGLVRYCVDYVRRKKNKAVEDSESSPGVLFSSGLIAGGAISGIFLALILLNKKLNETLDLSSLFPKLAEHNGTAVLAFSLMAWALFRVGRGKKLLPLG